VDVKAALRRRGGGKREGAPGMGLGESLLRPLTVSVTESMLCAWITYPTESQLSQTLSATHGARIACLRPVLKAPLAISGAAPGTALGIDR
jgi:hypothetical protein